MDLLSRRQALRLLTAGAAGACCCAPSLTCASAGALAERRAEPPTSRMLLSERGCGRATGYAETNKIVSLGDKTHVAWLDSEEGGFRVRVRTLDRRRGVWSPTVTVGEAYDNHGGPALTVDSRGHLHLVYYPHHHPFRYRRSRRPNDASEWEPEVELGAKCTYPTLICGPDDTLTLTCRESALDPWVVNLYTKRPGEPWGGPVAILCSSTRGYSHFQEALAWGPDGQTLHLSCRFYGGSPGRGHTVGYMRSGDGGRTWASAAGEPVELPATADTVSVVARDEGTVGPGLRCGAIAVDPGGVPHILFSLSDEGPSRAWIASPDETGAWKRRSLDSEVPRELGGWGLTLPGGLVFGKGGELFVVLTLLRPDTPDAGGVWGHPTSEVLLLRSHDGGTTFDARMLSEADPGRPHWLPNIERPAGHHGVEAPGVIYTDGSRGAGNRDILSNRVWWVSAGSAL